MQRFIAIARIIHFDGNVILSFVISTVLSCNDKLISNSAFFSPFSNKLFRAFVLVSIGRVYKISLIETLLAKQMS
jgi:hypothetical protein